MPELPEVETVRRLLAAKIVGQTIAAVEFLWPDTAVGSAETTAAGLLHAKIEGVHRRGKFLILALTEGKHLVIHLRMEGKLFVHEPGQWKKSKFDCVVLTFANGEQLVFADVRKFGRMWFYDSNQPLTCLAHLGPEATDLDAAYVLEVLQKNRKPLKTILLDQALWAGIGNIYADEICFAVGLNPFRRANLLACAPVAAKLVAAAGDILQRATDLQGSSVHTYQASATVKGNYQNMLMVYGRQGQPCKICQTIIMKRTLGGRGTSYCPRCQKVGEVLGLTGRIAAGKTTARLMLEDQGYRGLDTDALVKKLYEEKRIQKQLIDIAPAAFSESGALNRDYLREKLTQDSGFRRGWLDTLYPLLKVRVEKILNDNPTDNFALEAPLLFKAQLDSLCNRIILLQTTSALQRLQDKGLPNPGALLALSQTNNDWIGHRDQVTAVIETDSSLADLRQRLQEILPPTSVVANE